MTASLRATLRLIREHWLAIVLMVLSATAYVVDVKRDHLAILAILCQDHPRDSLCLERHR